MPKPLHLNLTEPQRQELTWQREQPRQPSLRERCAALLVLARARAAHVACARLSKRREIE